MNGCSDVIDNVRGIVSRVETNTKKHISVHKTSKLSATARNKVVNRSGGNYLSFRADINNPSYGLGIDNPSTKSCAASGCSEKIDDSLTYCSKHSQVSSSSLSKTVTKSEKSDISEEEGTTHHPDGSVTKYKKRSFSSTTTTTTTTN
ncbi:hypothetical protein RhiirA5_382619 [Rhizophagus irregularis]|uniref:Uncharacterized protein n=1 Tax=Rhizophagus irregularis TaxID=588596 RepID=A0A2I1FDZ5_9GLOM|nr:hypothetical protein RhiirA5_382619 [Rhizophagus irregularis]PKC58225.1 hypothetical protein RhiirA1_400804 [Rhizophagus irregularis]PKY32610.1 hypothetical protein RhiirB3_394168 [Rhizophagus irregularis]CAB4492053.1 unnamed protein product [Rhizophagus irregularis]CAB5159466.1 unnamed protein product [Rhizophagus irregularis]